MIDECAAGDLSRQIYIREHNHYNQMANSQRPSTSGKQPVFVGKILSTKETSSTKRPEASGKRQDAAASSQYQ